MPIITRTQLETIVPARSEHSPNAQVHFMRLTRYTDKMITLFNQHLEARIGKGVNVVDLTSSGDALSDQFEALVTREVSRDWVHRA